MNYDQVMQAKKSGQPLGMEDKMMAAPPMPPELEAMGQQVQAKEDEAFGMASPQGDFHAKQLNTLVDGLNQVLPLFGVDAYPTFSEDTTVFPPDFVRLLSMVAKAAGDSGSMELDLTDVKTDRDLVVLAGKLSALAKDRDFRDFLKQPAKPAAVDAKQGKKVEASEKPSMSDEEMDALFASRV